MKILNNYSRLVPWFMATVLTALAAGCGGGGNDQAPILGTGAGTATMAPAVTAVTPTAGATAILISRKTLTAAFSKAMDSATIGTNSFTLTCPGTTAISGTVASYAAAGNVATLTLPATSNLPASALCTATVTTAARDTAGVGLLSNFSWTFTTGANPDSKAPTVTGTVNANGATNVAINTDVAATFSEAMNPATISNAQFTMKESISGTAIPGSITYADVTAEFKPLAALSANTRYTMTIKGAASGVTDIAGNAMANDYVWSWTTGQSLDKTAPTVTGTINANGAVNVPVNTKTGATFSEAISVASLTSTNFSLKETNTGKVIAGTASYSGVNAVFVPQSALALNTSYTGTIKGGANGIKDLAGNAMVSDYVWSWTTGSVLDTTAPMVTSVNPADLATNVPVTSAVNATFSEAMDPLTMSTGNFSVAGITGSVSYNVASKVVTFTPSTNLAANTTYTATIDTGAQDLAGNALAVNKVWSFTTAAAAVIPPSINLGAASAYGTFGGTAGMTNQGLATVVNGNIGTTATGASSITGFHDNGIGVNRDVYTETPLNAGFVNGSILTCTVSTTGPTSAAINPADCTQANAGLAAASAAYGALAGLPAGANPGADLGGLTLAPGVYTAPSGSFMISSPGLTLDAQGNAGAVWVFQMATSLTVGPSVSITLAGGAQAGNVYWQVGSAATINPAGGGTMVGTIIAQSGITFSTAGNASAVTLNGRALSLGASVTLVNTVINVP